MLDKLLGVASALAYAAGTVAAPAGPDAEVVMTFADADVVESSGLVAAGRLFVTTNDSGDGGRVFVVDRSGRTVGTTSWEPEPQDTEALAPAGDGFVWVGDTGDNARSRESVTVLRVPVGRTDRTVTPTAYELVYPDHAHDAETLMADPRTGQLFVVSKDIFGGTVYAAPERLSAARPNELTEVAHGPSVATDGSFFPDGRHYVVRGYARATVYSYPAHEVVGSFALPQQRQGEGIAVGADDEIYLSTEGQFTDLLQVALPPDIAAAVAAEPAAAPGSEPAVVAAVESGSPWPWLVGGVASAAFAAVCGWLLLRRGAAS